MPRPGPSPVFAILSCTLLLGCTAPAPTPTVVPQTGGTLRVVVELNGTEALPGSPYYDPGTYSYSSLNRCCLLRTLLSYNGGPLEEGGAELRPDLAADLPEVSADGLTWEFTLRPGLHYAPPLEERTIEARDFITAAEHAVRIGDNPPFLQDIVGVAEFQDGSVDSIAGIEAPDATTVRYRLTAPAGDFGNRVAISLMAPLPEEALVGRDDKDYAGFLIASGPYMYQGADSIDLEDPGASPIWAGREAGRITLVRNPSWSRATDPLRTANAEHIEVIAVEDISEGVPLIESGEADLLGQPAPVSVARRWLADDVLRSRVFSQAAIHVFYMSMNVAVPPFDDVHVRRAVNLAIDRAAAARAIGEAYDRSTVVAHHVFPDAVENGLLRTYDPYPSNGDAGDLEAAREEMRKSRYDADEDGRCDAIVCSGVSATSLGGDNDIGPWSLIVGDLAAIGIELIPTTEDPFSPRGRVGALVNLGWGADYPSGANFTGLIGPEGLSDEFALNVSLVGASAEQLTSWGYRVTAVPSLNGKVDSCRQAVGSAAFLCWAELDQLITERVAPWVPLAFVDHQWVYSERVVDFSPDGESVSPSLDQIRLVPEN